MIKRIWHKYWYEYYKKRYVYAVKYNKEYGFYDCQQIIGSWIAERKMKEHYRLFKKC